MKKKNEKDSYFSATSCNVALSVEIPTIVSLCEVSRDKNLPFSVAVKVPEVTHPLESTGVYYYQNKGVL